jgi:ribonuclease BN (tRNA processing enzyme)
MRIKFLGRGGAFAPMNIGNSNMMITSDQNHRFMLDFGTTAPYIYRDEWKMDFADIDAVWISHLHADHCSLEMLAFHRYFLPKRNSAGERVVPNLYMSQSLMEMMWENTLSGGLKSLQGKIMTLTDYFDCHPVAANGSFVWDSIKFTPIQTIHIRSGYIIMDSYGLLMELPNGKVIYQTSDTQFDLGLMPFYQKADVIFHDCETGSHKSVVHAHYSDLKTLPADIRKKMWLYHYNLSEVNYKRDGFAGFVEKGQEFEF